jgi:hypothetical protein
LVANVVKNIAGWHHCVCIYSSVSGKEKKEKRREYEKDGKLAK